MAVTADQGAGSVAVQKVNWTSSAAVAPGYYWALFLPIGTTVPSIASYPLSAEAQLLLTGTGVLNFTVGSSLRFATGGTGLTGLSSPPAALTSSMTVTANANAWFVGIA